MEATVANTDGSREEIKLHALAFVRSCNRKHRRALHDHLADKSDVRPHYPRESDVTQPIPRLLATYTTWVSSSNVETTLLFERSLEQSLVQIAHSVLHGNLLVSALVEDLVASVPFPVIIAWKLHELCALDFNHVLCRAICPGTPFRKRTHPSSSRDIDVSSTGVVRLAAALDTVPPASMRDYSAILGHILATYVDTSCSQHPRQVSPPVLRIAVHALVRHLCDVQRAGSSYLPLLQHISPALASHPAMQTLLKTQLLAHVLKRHAATYPDFVLHYIQLARRKLNALAASSSSPLHKDNNNHDLEDHINTFHDTGKVPAPIRTRLLLQDATWHGKLKPALLAARDVGSHVLSLGWMQLVHTLVREGAIRHSEYAPFVAAMHGIVQVRAASRGAECPVDQLATELVDSMAGTCGAGAVVAPGQPTDATIVVPRGVVQFLQWIQARHVYGGSGEEDVAGSLDHLPSPEDYFAIWLGYELHQPKHRNEAVVSTSLYRLDCMSTMFMQMHKTSSLQLSSAITTVCSLGKELLRHQGTECFESTCDTVLR
ncbi:hypothetical protein DYB38_006865 [Aphanomyces astaci]|uniref:Uncharacterized protein n=1 Tax=Aphanomyces astaci TaxID=112090 RepID=A0A397C8I7_APHAT|nr:hypothetical protein DYB38_006865 [Aphanomyces astaci]